MKKMSAVIVTFFLVLISGGAHAEAGETLSVALPVGFIDVAFSSKSGDFFGVNAKGLYILAEDGSIKKVCSSEDDEEYGRVVVSGEDVWVTVIGKRSVDHFDLEGRLIERKGFHCDDMEEIFSVRAHQNFLIFHGVEKDTRQVGLWICDLDTGLYKKLTEGNVNCYDVAPSGLIYALSVIAKGDEETDGYAHSTDYQSILRIFDTGGHLVRDAIALPGPASALCAIA